MDRKKRNDYILIGGLLLTALIWFFISLRGIPGQVMTAEVSVEGKILASYPLSDDVSLIIDGVKGGTNHLVIEGGTAAITEASCPDKVCVHQGTIKESGQTIVCLPNKVVVTIK